MTEVEARGLWTEAYQKGKGNNALAERLLHSRPVTSDGSLLSFFQPLLLYFLEKPFSCLWKQSMQTNPMPNPLSNGLSLPKSFLWSIIFSWKPTNIIKKKKKLSFIGHSSHTLQSRPQINDLSSFTTWPSPECHPCSMAEILWKTTVKDIESEVGRPEFKSWIRVSVLCPLHTSCFTLFTYDIEKVTPSISLLNQVSYHDVSRCLTSKLL